MSTTTYTQAQVEELLHKAEPAPKPGPEPRFITFHDPGISLLQMREKWPKLFYEQSWYSNEEVAKLTEEPQMRIIRIVPDSNNKTFTEQAALLEKGEEVTKARQLAMLSIVMELGGDEKLKEMVDGWVRCAEQTTDGNRVDLSWNEGRLRVSYYWVDGRSDGVWLSSCKSI